MNRRIPVILLAILTVLTISACQKIEDRPAAEATKPTPLPPSLVRAPVFGPESAARFARLALECADQEYPNKPVHQFDFFCNAKSSPLTFLVPFRVSRKKGSS